MSRTRAAANLTKRVALEVVGWTLVVAGVAALVLPGPGLLAIVAGLAILSQQYEWAERRLEPVKVRALRAAAEGVETWPRIAMSTLASLAIIGFGVLWVAHPPAPDWWPLRDSFWLMGGWGAGLTMVASGLFALGMVVYSIRHFRGAGAESPP